MQSVTWIIGYRSMIFLSSSLDSSCRYMCLQRARVLLCVFVAQCHFSLSLSPCLLPLFSPIDYVLCSRYASIRKRKRAKNKIFVCVQCDVMCWQTRRLSVSLSLALSFFRLFAFVDEEQRKRGRKEVIGNIYIKKRMEKKRRKSLYIYICVCVLIYLAWVVRMVIGKTQDIGRNHYQDSNIHRLLIVSLVFSSISEMESEHSAPLFFLSEFLRYSHMKSDVERRRAHVW